MVLGNLFHMIGAYMLNPQLAKVLFLCGTSSCCVKFSDCRPGLFTNFSLSKSWRYLGAFFMPTFMDQCENFVVNALFYWEPM